MARYATISASFSGNRGSEAMLQSAIYNLSLLDKSAIFDVISVYPAEDRKENVNPRVNIVSINPHKYMVTSLLEVILFRIGLRSLNFIYSDTIKSLIKADLVIDLSGISFVDGRGLPILIYNAFYVLIPKLLRKKVIKIAQAMGPFKSSYNKKLAKLCLNRVDTICSRGSITSSYLKELGIKDFYQFTDAAFSMPYHEEKIPTIDAMLKSLKDKTKPVVGFCPSVVVKEYCQKQGLDYFLLMNELIDYIVGKGYRVIVFAHSARRKMDVKTNNDIPICRELYERRTNNKDVLLLDKIFTAHELRYLISKCDLFVGSRFHSIISALCVAVPFFLIGWSHKYSEVLREFDLEEQSIDFKDMKSDLLFNAFDKLSQDQELIRTKILNNIERVAELSRHNFQKAIELLKGA